MTVEVHARSTPLYIRYIVVDPSGRFLPSLQRRMSARMDSSSATTKGVYRPSGGATMTTTAQTTAMKKIAVSVQTVRYESDGSQQCKIYISFCLLKVDLLLLPGIPGTAAISCLLELDIMVCS